MDVSLPILLAGASHCSASNAHCADCPMKTICATREENIVDRLVSALKKTWANLKEAESKARQAEYEKSLLVNHVFSIVRQRDAAVSDLKRAEEFAAIMQSLLDTEVHPECDYGLYCTLCDALSDITLWQHKDIWWGDRDQFLHDPNNEKGTSTNDKTA